mgnify:CR=1 FL=1
MNLEELKLFIQSELNYTEFTQEGSTLKIVINRDKGKSVVTLTLIDGRVKVVETYESRELGGTISKVRRFKSFKRLQNFLLLFNGGRVD